MSKINYKLLLIVPLLALQLVIDACASHLPRERNVKSQALEMSLDLRALVFTDLDSGLPVDLADYMDRTGKSHLLLVFGSRACSVCTEKNERLRDEFLPRYPLFAAEHERDFEMIGVNTDPEHAHEAVLRYREGHRFGFIRWSDPRGRTLEEYLLPRGDAMGVPFTALVSRDGLVFRVTNHDDVSLDETLARAMQVVSGKEAPVTTTPATPVAVEPTDHPVVITQAKGPSRFDDVKVKSCAGGDEIALSSALSTGRVRFLELIPGKCDAACAASHAALRRAAAGCKAADAPAGDSTDGRTTSASPGACAAVTVATDGLADDSLCSEELYAGGADLLATYAGFFDWQLKANEGPAGPVLPPLTGPLLLAFDDSGKLVDGQRGPIDAAALTARLADPSQFKDPARGPDFPLYVAGKGKVGFSELRRQSDYTVIFTFASDCAGCVDELKALSAPGGTVDVCAANPDKCQLLALETTLPFEPAADLGQYRDALATGLREKGIRATVVLDPTPYDADGNAYDRYFEGYLSARHPEWDGLYGAVVYDREGLLVAAFKAEAAGRHPVAEAVRALTGL